MSEAPKLWRIIAGRKGDISIAGYEPQYEESEFIVAGETLTDVWNKYGEELSGYEYIKASAVV